MTTSAKDPAKEKALTMMIIQHKKIAVVGGGPGGLTLARLLQLQGVDVTVYEREADRTARHQGPPWTCTTTRD